MQTFTVLLVDELGNPVSGVPFAMKHGDASDTETSDDSGQAQIADDAVLVATASFADANALREALRDRWNAPRDGDFVQEADNVTVVELHGDLPSVDLAPGVTHTLSVQPYVERGRLLGGYFDTSKSFLLPSGLDGVRAIVAMYGDNQGAALLIVGHTDTSGSTAYNDPLSLERANALKDYLTQNVYGWLPWYGEAKPKEKRWGIGEDTAMIGALPDAGSRDDSESPIAWYRRTRGLPPGEKPDKPMRQKLIGEYMALEGTSLPDGISVTTHGCGENFPADATPDGVADPDNRRVEVFFFDGVLGVQPPPPGDNSGPGSTEYPEWVKRAKRTRDHEHGNDHSVVINLALRDPGAFLLRNAPYRVTVDGAEWTGRAPEGLVSITVSGRPTRCTAEWGIADDPDMGGTAGPPRFQRELYLDYDQGSDEEQVVKRLHNLGYPEDATLEVNVFTFQQCAGLPPTGSLDDQTRDTLKSTHGTLATQVEDDGNAAA
jgi:outer membrane protein OmpA-like peptidoglycan-associated protein